jgi:hypothetical protein
MRLPSPTLILLTLLALALPAGAGSAATAPAPADTSAAHALIAQVLAAYGGRAALAHVRAYRLEGDVYSAMRHESAPTTRVFARPGRLKVRIEYAHGAEVRLLDGARGWHAEGGGPLDESHGPMLDAMTLQAARADVPWVLAERESLARVIEPQRLDSLQLLGVEVALGDGLLLRAYVDPLTHLVRVSQGVLERGPMHTHFETLYSDFRDVQGVKFAFHEDNRASGMQTGVTTVKRVIIDPALAKGEFAPDLSMPPATAPRDSTRRGGS